MRNVIMGLVTMKLVITGSVILGIVIRRIMMVGTVPGLWIAVHRVCQSFHFWHCGLRYGHEAKRPPRGHLA